MKIPDPMVVIARQKGKIVGVWKREQGLVVWHMEPGEINAN
jgi:hypothetical protein